MSDSRSGYDEQSAVARSRSTTRTGRAGSRRARCLRRLLVVLARGAIVAGTFFWLGRRDTAVSRALPKLIKAEPGPYKVKPTNPGGLDVAGESETAFETSAGEDSDAQLDLNKLPETPVAKPPKVEPKPLRPANRGACCRASTRARQPHRRVGQRDPARRLR